VLDTIYAVFGSAWEPTEGTEVRWTELRDEAIRLGRLLVELLPGRPEADGLLALMLHCEARRPARRDPEGRFVPLDEQDVALWDLDLIEEAERRLTSAARHQLPGRYQLEAAIQSAHAARRFGRGVDWADIALFYDELLRIEPTIAAATARAAVIARIEGPEAGLAALERLPESAIKDYQPFWATRVELLRSAGLRREAEAAYDRAIGLTDDPGVRAHLLGRRARIFT
jgi:RNA polymerase sigma-70 factor (ECF subfamily)